MYRPLHIERNWVFLDQVVVPQDLRNFGDYPDIVYQTLVRRGYADLTRARQFVNCSEYPSASPFDLPDMDRAISRIHQAIDTGQKIGVWGDFDVDGQTSTALLVSALREIGARVIHHIPVRGPESHGIGLKPLKEFIQQGVEVILTCDTGVSAFDAIHYAQSTGIDVIVTDHHTLPETLPPACALINPHRLPADHPLATLPGAGTALKFAEALLKEYGLQDKSRLLHDLAALGCVADLAELTGETRYLVQSGLNHLRSTPRPAVAAILQAAGVDYMKLTEEHISFTLAPRLNAVGRLDDANPMVSFLLSEDPVEIAVMVNKIEGLNSKRKFLCDQVFQGAIAQLEQDRSLLEQPILILQHQEWPAGVVGIVASRLVEIFHRPVILLVASPGGELRGSARSIKGIDITAALSQNQHHLLTFGGHPMAAGLSLRSESVDGFKREMFRTIAEVAAARQISADLVIDARIDPSLITLDFARSLEVLSPFGPGNPPLLFAAEGLHIVTTATVGKLGEHRVVDVENPDGDQVRFLWWNGADLPLPEGRFDLAYSVHASDFRGVEQVQFEWIDFKQGQEKSPLEIRKYDRKLVNYDYRQSKNPGDDLVRLATNQALNVWIEGRCTCPVRGSDRSSIVPCDALALWSVPPNIKVLRQVLQAAHPSQLHWFLVPPHEHQIQGFLKALGNLVKEGLHAQQQYYQLIDVAIHLASTEEVVELGLQWLARSGHISILEKTPTSYRILPGGDPDAAERSLLQGRLQQAFAEIHAFYAFLKQADLDRLSDELA